ncbi:hypothetical protein HZA99_02155 [Candidatus Woesearchaeota archaeon]|nr:hypothetical protein [Candidatus Woesearchaeota archaeon]
MNKKVKMVSLLILGKGDTDYSDRNMQRLFTCAQEAGIDVQRRDYGEIETTPDFKNEKIQVLLFFPFTFWNANCEVPQDTKLYGTSKASYDLFQRFFLERQEALNERYGSSHKLDYVIQPAFAALDRDKVATVEQLQRFDVPTSRVIESRDISEILDHVAPERGVFIKCRYGAEGKGITVLHHGIWRTNYNVHEGKLDNYGTYGTWTFTDITGKRELLEQLLEHEVIVEREVIVPEIFPGKKFDVRAYVVNGHVPHLFARVNGAERVVTNYSQGARVLHHPETGLDEAYIESIRKEATKAARAFSSRFLGVDIMFDGNAETPRVIEIQTFTDYPDPRKFNLVKYMISIPT